jgi:hypothetical protein
MRTFLQSTTNRHSNSVAHQIYSCSIQEDFGSKQIHNRCRYWRPFDSTLAQFIWLLFPIGILCELLIMGHIHSAKLVCLKSSLGLLRGPAPVSL